jgi:hypothetical protein
MAQKVLKYVILSGLAVILAGDLRAEIISIDTAHLPEGTTMQFVYISTNTRQTKTQVIEAHNRLVTVATNLTTWNLYYLYEAWHFQSISQEYREQLFKCLTSTGVR